MDKLHVGGKSYQAVAILGQVKELHNDIRKILNEISILPPATVVSHYGSEGCRSQFGNFIHRSPGSQPKVLLTLGAVCDYFPGFNFERIL